MATKNRQFVVQMYETEYRQIQAWVAKHQHIETGGDLFGLWADDHTAVVQLVLGPGKNCRRSTVSFYQDIDYLERVGNVLTSKEGLCHIGEWHSHHRIGLTRPSGGDENTVWTNMDRYGIHRFFLFIATIGSSTYDVDIGCFLFESNRNTKRQLPVLKGEIRSFAGNEESPFRESAHQCLTNGAESLNTWQWLNRFNANRFTGKRSFNHVEQHQNGKKPRKNDPKKEACQTTQMLFDQNPTGESELENQEDKGESTPVKDREKPNLYEEEEEEEESQDNETTCIPFKKNKIDYDKQQPDLAEDSKKPKNQESQAGRLTPALSNDSDRNDRYTGKIPVMKKSIEDDNQEEEPESKTTKDAENSKISQEIFAFPTADQNDNVELGKRQLKPTENKKSENLKNHSLVTAKENKDKDALSPQDAKKPKVQYIGHEEGKNRQEALHDKVSGDVQATMGTNSKVIEVKPANEDSNPNQPQNSNTLDKNKGDLKEQSSKEYAEDDIKDVQQNERKHPSTVCEEMKEIKSENEGSDTEGEKSISKFLCIPIWRKTSQDKKKEKKTEKREEKNEKQIEKKRKKKEKKQKKEEKKEKKKQKKEEKKEKKKQKQEKKKENKKEKKETESQKNPTNLAIVSAEK